MALALESATESAALAKESAALAKELAALAMELAALAMESAELAMGSEAEVRRMPSGQLFETICQSLHSYRRPPF